MDLNNAILENINLDNIIPSFPKLYRQCTITGIEDVIDIETGLPLAIVKYYEIEKINFKNDSNIERIFYNMICKHRLCVIDYIIILINIVRQKNILYIINFHIIEYLFYKQDLKIVKIAINN